MAVDTNVIEKVVTIAASPETVFRFLTDPVKYVEWKGSLAELEPRAGGSFCHAPGLSRSTHTPMYLPSSMCASTPKSAARSIMMAPRSRT